MKKKSKQTNFFTLPETITSFLEQCADFILRPYFEYFLLEVLLLKNFIEHI